jgi:hypothetical protein
MDAEIRKVARSMRRGWLASYTSAKMEKGKKRDRS